MPEEKGNSLWWIMLILSCLLIAFTVFAISSGDSVLVNGIIQGGYEMFILCWSGLCTQTYIFLVLGLVALVSLLVARKWLALTKIQTR
jgi:hypothetical protein